jgi:hypothetical protein
MSKQFGLKILLDKYSEEQLFVIFLIALIGGLRLAREFPLTLLVSFTWNISTIAELNSINS